jgi:structure-specific recognition protein 1
MEQISLKGVNLITEIDISTSKVEAKNNRRTVVEFPTNSIGNCSTVTNDLVIELNEEARTGKEDMLVEVRLCVHLPQQEDFMDNLMHRIKKYANCEDGEDNQICILPELPFAVPRGRYTADFFTNNFKLHGSSYNYTISYKNITKAFLLPMPDKITVCFVIGFDKPLRQGQTEYKYVVITFKLDQEIELELKGRLDIIKKIDEGLTTHMSGKYFEVFTKLLRGLSGINIVIPSDFKTSKDESAIKCSIGARQGHLFILNKSLIFIFKPIIHVKFEEIARVQLHRITSKVVSRAFDLEVILNSGQSHLFSGIDKIESENILKALTKSNVMVTTAKDDGMEVEEEYEDDHDNDEDNALREESEEEYTDEEFIAKDQASIAEEEDDDYKPSDAKKKESFKRR